MGRRRGFFADIQYQLAVAERERQRTYAAALREQVRLHRAAEQAHAAAQRARTQAARAEARARAEAEREARRLHVEAQESRVESLNFALQLRLSEIDNILRATLGVDDYVDLEKLRRHVKHPPFASRHNAPTHPPPPIQPVPAPVFVPPEAPTGISALFGKKKHLEAVARAQADHATRHHAWQQDAAAAPERQRAQQAAHHRAEEIRRANLSKDMERYRAKCVARQAEADAHNAKLDTLIRELGEGKAHAVEEYVGIVFGNSVYPDDFPWPPTVRYDTESQELVVQLPLPAPQQLPSTSEYRYVRAKDEIAQRSQTLKEQRDRYSALVANMSLRTLHEIWESDRTEKVGTISLTGYVAHLDPATGKEVTTPLVAIATDRDTFLDLDLAKITPSETLKHLNAAVSKNPHALAPIDLAHGIRGH